jgi:hypothetical protein
MRAIMQDAMQAASAADPAREFWSAITRAKRRLLYEVRWLPMISSRLDLQTMLIVVATVACYRYVVSPAIRAAAVALEPRRPDSAAGRTGDGSAAGSAPLGAEPARRVWRKRLLAGGVLLLLAVLSFAASRAGLPAAMGHLAILMYVVVGIVTWRCATIDYDQRLPIGQQRRDRLLVIPLAALACLYPLFLFAWLAHCCGRLMAWQHHAMMAIRIVKGCQAWLLALLCLRAGTVHFSPVAEQASLLLGLGCLSLSHYLKPAWSKARLGPHWWSWAWHNRLHYGLTSAYSWGWARFLPPHLAARIWRATRPMDRPLGCLTMAVESSPLIAFFDHRLLVAVLIATACFHIMIFLAIGILFWESLCVNVVFAVIVGYSPAEVDRYAFGVTAAVVAIAVMVLSTADLSWKPFHLGWWETTFTARIVWQVETADGEVLGLYNNYMCPFERDFGRFLGYFLYPEPVLHGPIGGTFDRAVRDRVLTARDDREQLAELKRRHGKVRWDPARAARHVDYLATTFAKLNAGYPKGPLKGRFRWFKAPGGQIFYWGDLPPYRGQRPVRRVIIRCQERCYLPDQNRLVLVADQVLREIEVPSVPGAPSVPLLPAADPSGRPSHRATGGRLTEGRVPEEPSARGAD